MSNSRKFEFENIFLHLGLISTLWYLAYKLSKFIITALVLSLITRWLVILLSCRLRSRVVDTTTTSRWKFFFVARLRWLHFFLCTLRSIFWASTSLMWVIFLWRVFISLICLHQIAPTALLWVLKFFCMTLMLKIWVTQFKLNKNTLTIHFLSLIELIFLLRLILMTDINVVVYVAILPIQVRFYSRPLVPFVWVLGFCLTRSLFTFITVSWYLSNIWKSLPISGWLHNLGLIERAPLIFSIIVFRVVPQRVFCVPSRANTLAEEGLVNVCNFRWILNWVPTFFALMLLISNTWSFVLTTNTISSTLSFSILLVMSTPRLLAYAKELVL